MKKLKPLDPIAGLKPSPYCDHPEKEFRRRIKTNGARFITQQCLKCGQSSDFLISRDSFTEEQFEAMPMWDEERAKEGGHDAWKRWQEQHAAEKALEQAAADAAFWEKYDLYLASPEWRRKRLLILKRDNWTCQACLIAEATDVHHHTTVNLGNELCWQLISICRPCHDRIPSRRKEYEARRNSAKDD
jgi:hypothetical protein